MRSRFLGGALVAVGTTVLAQTPAPAFEVASVKANTSTPTKAAIQTLPGERFVATGVTMRQLLLYAYDLQPNQIAGGPDWLAKTRFDITAKGAVESDDAARVDQPSQSALMLRSLLADRFAFRAHNDMRELPVYALELANKAAKLGPQIKASALECGGVDAKGRPSKSSRACGIRKGGGQGTMVVGGASLAQVAASLSKFVDRPVVDRTGLRGSFDLTLSWTPDSLDRGFEKKGASKGAPQNGPSIFTALQEQLGLKLVPEKTKVKVLVIDHIERPRPN